MLTNLLELVEKYIPTYVLCTYDTIIKPQYVSISYLTQRPLDNDHMQGIIDNLSICRAIDNDLKLQWTDRIITVSGTLRYEYTVRFYTIVLYGLNQILYTEKLRLIEYQNKNIIKFL